MIRRTRLAALLLAVAVCPGACVRSSRPVDRPLVVATASGPTTLDPGLALDEASQKIDQLLFSSLLKTDESLHVVRDLATRFESSDSQTYIAEIPHGVRFHDGREMTSADVAFTFRRFLDPAFVSARKGAYQMLKDVSIVDNYTVAFHLTAPTASFPINLVMGIVPAGTGPEAARRPIGSGPYSLAEFVPDDHVTLAPFAGAYRGAPSNSGLMFKVVPDETMRSLELRQGGVDLVINDLSPDSVHALRGEGRLAVTTAPGTDYAYVGFNLRDPLLQDRRVRQAIGYAIDQMAIVKYLRRDLAEPAESIVPPMSWAHPPDLFRFTHDVAKAGALLDEAGYRDPDGTGAQPRLHLTFKTSMDERYRQQAAVIQRNLAEVGIALDVRSVEFATLMSDVQHGNVQLYSMQWVGVTDPDILRRVFHSAEEPPNGFNRGYYENHEVDRLIDAATAALDEPERRRLYGEAQRLIASDAPYVSLWYKTNVVVAQPDLRGVSVSPTAEFTFLAGVSRRARFE